MLRQLDLSIHIASYDLERPRKDMKKGDLLNYELKSDQTSYILYQPLLNAPFLSNIWPLQVMNTIPNLLFIKSSRQTSFHVKLKFDLGSLVQLEQDHIEVWYHLAHILIYEVDISKMHHIFKYPVQVNGVLQDFWYEQFTKPAKFVTCPIEFIPVYYKPDDIFVLIYELDDPSQCKSGDNAFPQVIQTKIEAQNRYVIDTTTSSSEDILISMSSSEDDFDDIADEISPGQTELTSSQRLSEKEEEEILEEEEALGTYAPIEDNGDSDNGDSEEEFPENDTDSEQSFDFSFQDSSEDENYEEDCNDHLVKNLPESTSTFEGPTLCNPCDLCYINSALQIVYHIPELNQYLTDTTFPPSELRSIQHILQIMNRKLHYIKVSKLYTKEMLPNIRKQSKDAGLVLQTIFSLISEFNEQGKNLIESLFEIQVTYRHQTDGTTVTEKHSIIDIYAQNYHTTISLAFKESLCKPGYALQGITNDNQYLIFRLNRRYLERKNLHTVQFSNTFNLFGNTYFLKMMIVHHGIGEHGGHYYCLIRKNVKASTVEEMLQSCEYWKISDKYASVTNPSLDLLSGSDTIEEYISSGFYSASSVSSYDTASILIFQKSSQYFPLYFV